MRETAATPIALGAISEIRLVCSRDRGLLSWEPLGVFGANMFRPFNQRAAIRYRRRPGHRKSAFILDRELELQVLALTFQPPITTISLFWLRVPQLAAEILVP